MRSLQLAFKSMQVVPVLVLRVFLLHKRYLLWDYLAVGLMVLGITTFSVVDYSDGIKADLTGTRAQRRWRCVDPGLLASMCMLVALLLNGVINALQERILSRYGSSYAELVRAYSVVATLTSLSLRCTSVSSPPGRCCSSPSCSAARSATSCSPRRTRLSSCVWCAAAAD